MTSFKHPSFQDRANQAAAQKQKALEQLRLRPEPDEKTAAQRKAASERRLEVQAQKAAEKQEARNAATQLRVEARPQRQSLLGPIGRPHEMLAMQPGRLARNAKCTVTPETGVRFKLTQGYI